jgi:DNA-binding CsgD family transcriptional regulator
MHADRSSMLVAQRPNLNANPRPNAMQKSDVGNFLFTTRPNRDSAHEAHQSPEEINVPGAAPGVGLVVINSSLLPLSFNPEAVKILSYPTYPNNPRNGKRLDVFLAEKIRSGLVKHQLSGEFAFVTEFNSGRRRYHCRVFSLGGHSKGPSHPIMALLLERGIPGSVQVSQVSEQFNLTVREKEALGHLMQGLTSKEIANRMNISPNTVKAFLRLIMIKMGVTTRCAIVGKAVAAIP